MRKSKSLCWQLADVIGFLLVAAALLGVAWFGLVVLFSMGGLPQV